MFQCIPVCVFAKMTKWQVSPKRLSNLANTSKRRFQQRNVSVKRFLGVRSAVRRPQQQLIAEEFNLFVNCYKSPYSVSRNRRRK